MCLCQLEMYDFIKCQYAMFLYQILLIIFKLTAIDMVVSYTLCYIINIQELVRIAANLATE